MEDDKNDNVLHFNSPLKPAVKEDSEPGPFGATTLCEEVANELQETADWIDGHLAQNEDPEWILRNVLATLRMHVTDMRVYGQWRATEKIEAGEWDCA
jgi:hypothetical protein